MADADRPQVQASGRPLPPIEHRFQPGQSGNPGGRPKGALPRTAMLRELARSPDEDGIGANAVRAGKRYTALLIELETATAARSDIIRAELAELRHTFDQAEGKPQEKIEHSGNLKRVEIEFEDRPNVQDSP